jgi:hypothetical protein
MNACSIVIFGASGDLARRKLVPALFNLRRKGRPPEKPDRSRGRAAGRGVRPVHPGPSFDIPPF